MLLNWSADVVVVTECNIKQDVMGKNCLNSAGSVRPNHDIQWLYNDQWEPIFSLLLKKGISTNLEVDRERVW